MTTDTLIMITYVQLYYN